MCPGIDRTWNGSLPCSMYRRLLLGGWSAGGLRAILSVSIPSVSSWIAGGLCAAEPTASQEPLHLCCQEPRLFPLQCGVFCEHLVYASSLPALALAPVDFTAKFSTAHYVEHLRATVNLSNQSSRFLGLSSEPGQTRCGPPNGPLSDRQVAPLRLFLPEPADGPQAAPSLAFPGPLCALLRRPSGWDGHGQRLLTVWAAAPTQDQAAHPLRGPRIRRTILLK